MSNSNSNEHNSLLGGSVRKMNRNSPDSIGMKTSRSLRIPNRNNYFVSQSATLR